MEYEKQIKDILGKFLSGSDLSKCSKEVMDCINNEEMGEDDETDPVKIKIKIKALRKAN